mmetsp:Transcript_8387/g.23868  ORF Transcript_8387/g.23868 Transcript_8387/m.23868 type:complete len:339 (-) Transcript_8387:2441-3457(-)
MSVPPSVSVLFSLLCSLVVSLPSVAAAPTEISKAQFLGELLELVGELRDAIAGTKEPADPYVTGDIGDVQLNAALSTAIKTVRESEEYLDLLNTTFPAASFDLPECDASYPAREDAEGTFERVLDEGVLNVGLPGASSPKIRDFNAQTAELILREISAEYDTEVTPNFIVIDNTDDFFLQFREALNDQTVDTLTFFTITDERSESVDFTSCAIVNFVNEVGVWVPEASDLASVDLTEDPSPLNGTNVGVCPGCFFIDDFVAVTQELGLEVTLVEIPITELVDELRAGTVDAVATILTNGPGFSLFEAADDVVKLEGSFVLGDDTRAAVTRFAGPDRRR